VATHTARVGELAGPTHALLDAPVSVSTPIARDSSAAGALRRGAAR
jgi:hypothetical protein